MMWPELVWRFTKSFPRIWRTWTTLPDTGRRSPAQMPEALRPIQGWLADRSITGEAFFVMEFMPPTKTDPRPSRKQKASKRRFNYVTAWIAARTALMFRISCAESSPMSWRIWASLAECQ